ncbi:MAG: GDP-mannose 4,6-dehydratase, partial [Pseudomonadota bacterium]
MSKDQTRAIVIGVDGQDGSYMAEHLLELGWQVVGLGRRNTPRIGTGHDRFVYSRCDIRSADDLATLLEKHKPHRIYHLAAVHGASGYVYEDGWQDALAVNLGAVHICLEHIRNAAPETRLLYASSLKAFGTPSPAIVSEETPLRSDCLYSITKNAAVELIDYYRNHHGVRASALYLFNHESPRRASNFFLPRVTAMLAAAMKGEAVDNRLASLDFACDWGSALEFMKIGARLLEEDANSDYVIATGRTWTGLEFVEALFGAAGLDWRDHLDIAKPVGSENIRHYQAD